MINWKEMIQFRYKLDPQLREVLLGKGVDPDTWILGIQFIWHTESNFLFTALVDFRAHILDQMTKLNSTSSCLHKTISCVKVPDLFNVLQESLQHLHNIFSAYIPVLHTLYPNSTVLQHLNRRPILYSVVFPIIWLTSVFTFFLPCFYISKIFIKVSKDEKSYSISHEDLELEECLIFRDRCSCENDENSNRNRNQERKTGKLEKNIQWIIFIFSVILIIIFPFSIKLLKGILQNAFKDKIADSELDLSIWLVVVDKFLRILSN